MIFIGCKSVPEVLISDDRFLYDKGFEEFINVTIESEKEIWHISN